MTKITEAFNSCQDGFVKRAKRSLNEALVFDGDTYIQIEPYQVTAIDSNGAGDMFAGAFMYAITHGHSFAEAGKLASLASSKVVGQWGPRLTKEQVASVREHLLA